MPKLKRTTIYLDPAVRQSLTEDAADLAIFEARAREPVLALEAVLKDLKLRGGL